MIAAMELLLLLTGAGFTLLSGVGVYKMPDLYSRMQASTKAGTLGVSCLVLGVAIHFRDLGITTQALLVIAFLFLTAPAAAHMIARAAFIMQVPLWEGTVINELSEGYSPSAPTPPPPHEVVDQPEASPGKPRQPQTDQEDLAE